MAVLERYSDHECSLLLGCPRRDVLAARTRSLQQIGSEVENLYQHLTVNSANQTAERHAAFVQG